MQECQLATSEKTSAHLGQHAGISNPDKTQTPKKQVGQHAGMMGQHKQEWWVNMRRNLHSAYLWNYPDKKNIAIDEEYVKELHTYLKGKGGERFYVIAPGQSINFMQDELKHGDTIYTFLKVPVSVLIRLIQSGELSSFKQPKSEENVNEVIDAFGFDFISQPQVKYSLHKQNKKEGLFEKYQFVIRLSEFYSDGLLYSPEDFKNFETLSLVLIDYDYKEEPFTMDSYLWGKNLVKDETTPVEIAIDAEKWTKDKLAVIIIDDYGNEKILVLDKKEFK